jgi:predicted transcriptional regulator
MMTLREYLTQNGMTYQAFADAIGVSQAAVSRYVNQDRPNGRVPRRPVMRRIMEVTGGAVSPESFYPAPMAAMKEAV